ARWAGSSAPACGSCRGTRRTWSRPRSTATTRSPRSSRSPASWGCAATCGSGRTGGSGSKGERGGDADVAPALPARLDDAGEVALEGEVAQGDPGEPELAVEAAGTAGQRAAVAHPDRAGVAGQRAQLAAGRFALLGRQLLVGLGGLELFPQLGVPGHQLLAAFVVGDLACGRHSFSIPLRRRFDRVQSPENGAVNSTGVRRLAQAPESRRLESNRGPVRRAM